MEPTTVACNCRTPDVSQRGINASAEATSYFAAVIKLNERLWYTESQRRSKLKQSCAFLFWPKHRIAAPRSPEDPEGNIVMSIAENRLTVDLIKDKLQSKLSFPDSVFFYDNTAGSAKMKAAMIGLLQHTFMKVSGVPLHKGFSLVHTQPALCRRSWLLADV